MRAAVSRQSKIQKCSALYKKHLWPLPKVCCSVERFVFHSNGAFHHEVPNDDDLYMERFGLIHSADGFMQSDVQMRQDLTRTRSWAEEVNSVNSKMLKYSTLICVSWLILALLNINMHRRMSVYSYTPCAIVSGVSLEQTRGLLFMAYCIITSLIKVNHFWWTISFRRFHVQVL